MAESDIELADVLRRFIKPYRQRFGHLMLPSQRQAVDDILGCMTQAMGGSRYRCDDCQESFWSYHGCRNRSCPKCSGRQTAIWMEKRTAELLPCDYYHLVATVPAELRPLFLQNQKVMYDLLMKTVAAALCELALDRHYVGAVPAILAVLQTWTSQLHYHPHVHLMVSGGGLSKDGSTWFDSPKGFLVPAKKLSPMISQRFARTLRKEHPDLFAKVPPKAWRREWCSFCKHFGSGRESVLRYLARYVFSIGISNSRILTMDETHVTFRYKDNDTGTRKTMRIPGVEFIRRFLLHVPPKGFHKVRYYGLWGTANQARHHAAYLYLLLAQKQADADGPTLLAELAEEALTRSECESHGFIPTCPHCKSTNLSLLARRLRGGVAMVT